MTKSAILQTVALWVLVGSTLSVAVSQPVVFTEYGYQDGTPEIIELTNGDSLLVSRYDFILTGDSPDTENAVQFCTGHSVTNGGVRTAAGTCTRLYEGGDVQLLRWAYSGGETWTWKSVGGTGRYAGITCEGTGRGKFDFGGLIQSPKYRWVAELTGTCVGE